MELRKDEMRVSFRQRCPRAIRDWLGRWRIRRNRIHYGKLPRDAAFAAIYSNGVWGRGEEPFYSGPGSDDTFIRDYSRVIGDLVRSYCCRQIVDLGCGDFRVGRNILAATGCTYVGVDIVPGLIEYNTLRFSTERVSFRIADIVSDELPDGDLCLIRQVLQHLSNAEIQRVLERCRKYPLVVVTEHVSTGAGVVPNVDQVHGPDIRLYENSGVFLDKPPFCLKTERLTAMPYADGQELVSTLVRWPTRPLHEAEML